MDIKIPASLEFYNVRQVAKLIDYLMKEKDESVHVLVDTCNLISCVTGQKVEDLIRCDVNALKKAKELILSHIPTKLKEPPKTVIIKGQKFVFNKEVGSKAWSAMRFMDADNNSIDIDTKPERLTAICYIEDGKKYGFPEDEGGCMDLDKRSKIMLEHFKGSDFFYLQAFFLQKFYQLQPGFSLLQIAKAERLRSEAAKTMQGNG